MKKIVAFLLALMLCLGSFPAFADVNLSACTQEELLALRDSINKELLKRGIEKAVEVPPGIYIVGEDIPEGTYTITTYASSWFCSLTVSDRSGKRVFHGSFDNGEKIGKLVLENGYNVEIEYENAVFSPYQGLGF